MKSFHVWFVVSILLINLSVSCKKIEDALNPKDKDDTTGSLYDGKVNVSTQPANISIPDKIDVLIPQGAFTGDANITIKSLDPATLPTSADFNMYETFEITSTSGSTFPKNLEIKIKYDDSKGEKTIRNNGAAYYNETSKKWVPFNDVTVDTIQKVISIRSNHLTKLGRFSYSNQVLGYTDWASSTHFYIYWTEPGVMSNSVYISPFRSTLLGTDPHYIQDILRYMEDSWTAFNAANLELPNSKINVYVDKLDPGTDGETSFLGKIFISQNIPGNKFASGPELLQMTCAHELFHYVQDYYYVLYAAASNKTSVQWWLEATATQADRIVWPKKAKFEALDTELDLSNNLVKSWDDCLADPDWYIAGKFLCYLANYRAGSKLNIPEIVKEGGKETNLAYIRTIIDSHLKTKLGSTGIGDEFRDFVRCAFEAKGDIKYPTEAKPSLTPSQTNQKNSILRTSYDVSTNEISVPYLAAGFLKCANSTKEKQNVFAKLNKKSVEVDVFAYKTTLSGTRTFIQQLNEKDSFKISLLDDNEWIDLLVINKTKDAKGSAKATFRCEKVPYISAISPIKVKTGEDVTITGWSFGTKESTSDIYFNSTKVNSLSADVKSWEATQIVVKVPVGATTGLIYVKTKDGNSNNVNYEVATSLPKQMTGFLNNISVNYVDQDNKNSTKSESFGFVPTEVPTAQIGLITWSGNTFSYNITIPKDAGISYDRTYAITGTISGDQKTLLTFSYKRNDVAKSQGTGTNSTWTREIHRDREFTIENVPKDNYIVPNTIRFRITGTNFNSFKSKFSYTETWLTIDKFSDGTSKTENLTQNTVSSQATTATEFELLLK